MSAAFPLQTLRCSVLLGAVPIFGVFLTQAGRGVSGLVLSLFPGIDVLGMGFELEGFCVVRGPDLLWGGDIHSFHPPAGRFDGVIGGPPCQSFSPIGNVNRARWGEGSVMPDLIPEFTRVVEEARPNWWVMENSPYAYAPLAGCYELDLKNEWLGESAARHRRFWSSLPLHPDLPTFGNQSPEHTVTSGGAVDWKGSRAKRPTRSIHDMLELQGLPYYHLKDAPFTATAAKRAVANAVPLPMARAVARAVRKALEKAAA